VAQVLADVAAKGPVDAWILWVAAILAALGIIWRATRPLRDIGLRNRNIHDAVLGTPARVDKRTGTVLQEAQPGLVTSLREMTAEIGEAVHEMKAIRATAEDAQAKALDANVAARAATDAAAAVERALELHVEACAVPEKRMSA